MNKGDISKLQMSSARNISAICMFHLVIKFIGIRLEQFGWKSVNMGFSSPFCRIIEEVVGRFLLQNPGIKRRIMTESVKK